MAQPILTASSQNIPTWSRAPEPAHTPPRVWALKRTKPDAQVVKHDLKLTGRPAVPSVGSTGRCATATVVAGGKYLRIMPVPQAVGADREATSVERMQQIATGVGQTLRLIAVTGRPGLKLTYCNPPTQVRSTHTSCATAVHQNRRLSPCGTVIHCAPPSGRSSPLHVCTCRCLLLNRLR
jgi:hypothetical protein